jgi:hypothetical protein
VTQVWLHVSRQERTFGTSSVGTHGSVLDLVAAVDRRQCSGCGVSKDTRARSAA